MKWLKTSPSKRWHLNDAGFRIASKLRKSGAFFMVLISDCFFLSIEKILQLKEKLSYLYKQKPCINGLPEASIL
jgi:hypothetical protein